MFTSIYAMEYVIGANIWLLGCILCLVFIGLISFAVKTNRGKNTFYTLLGIMIPALFCDMGWFFIYFPKGEYVNHGIASAGGLLLYPVCMIIGVMIVTVMNKRYAD